MNRCARGSVDDADKAEPRWHSLRRFFIEQLGFPVHKLPLDAGFTCPNRDGKVGTGGCTYCINESFAPAAAKGGTKRSITQQVAEEIELARRRYGAIKFLAYFQAFTNTYAPPAVLRRIYREALAHPDVVGLSVGTRPDALSDEALDLLSTLAREGRHVWLELGLQSAHDETLRRINRGHSFAQFVEGWHRTRERKNLFLCAHLIHGLPGENRERMMETVERVAALKPDGIKIHHLHLIEGAALTHEWRLRPFPLLSVDEYVRLVADSLERLPPKCALQRFVGEVHGPGLVAPLWNIPKQRILAAIDAELARRGTRQGSLYRESP
jgi:hypothetical protein